MWKPIACEHHRPNTSLLHDNIPLVTLGTLINALISLLLLRMELTLRNLTPKARQLHKRTFTLTISCELDGLIICGSGLLKQFGQIL